MDAHECVACGVVQTAEGECPVCGNTDYEDVGSTDTASDGGGEMYVCDECGDEFDSERGLRSHSRVHND